ncbi:PP2C family protein-serine/threonine phosphatase [Streptomyces sp. NPDC005483]|uniref:PP2C family protein-serine/threonine phosphatase n=1 Tax=Streptomyces sp. NPDC005483 TaxID=3154882 RepID=UPI00339E1D13
MSQLRNILRGIGCDRQKPPGTILRRRLDLTHHNLVSAHDRHLPARPARRRYVDAGFSSAGHPPPLLITHDGDTRYLTGGHGLLHSVDPDPPYPHASEMSARSTVLLYTDGLIERRGEGLDTGMTQLRQHGRSRPRATADLLRRTPHLPGSRSRRKRRCPRPTLAHSTAQRPLRSVYRSAP